MTSQQITAALASGKIDQLEADYLLDLLDRIRSTFPPTELEARAAERIAKKMREDQPADPQ